jgi:hypothetical protein
MRGDAEPAAQIQAILLGGFRGYYLSKQAIPEIALIERHSSVSKRVRIIHCIVLGTLLAASVGLSRPLSPSDPPYSLSSWVREGSIIGIGSGLSAWFFLRLLFRRSGQQTHPLSRHSSFHASVSAWFARMAPQCIWQAALVSSIGMGLSYGLISGLRPPTRLIQGISVGLAVGLMGMTSILLTRVILVGSIKPLRFAERISWTWQVLRPEHLRTSAILAGTIFIFFGLSYWLSVGLSYGLSYWLSVGLSYGLSYGLILGLYQGIVQEHVEDQDRHHFNQGIRRSWRNGALLSLVSASLLAGIGVLSVGLIAALNSKLIPKPSAQLIAALNYGRNFGLLSVCMMLGSSFLLLWAMSGGLTVLRHYVIRWFLARSHCFPWRAQAFLDDAATRIFLQRVGGGYRFIHRRLQDYFADTTMPLP